MGCRHNVCHVFQVGTLFHQLDKLGFIDDFLTGCVHQQATFRHFVHQCIIDGILRFGSCRDMQGNDVASRVKFFGRIHSLHSILLDYFFRTESIERINLHTETFGNTGYVATHVTISVDTQFLAHQFRTGSTVIHITDSHHHQAESQLGHSIGVLSRSIHYTYVVGSSCFQVHIVITGTGTHHNLQFLGGI